MRMPRATENVRDLVEYQRNGPGANQAPPLASQCGGRCDARRLVRADLLTCCGKRPYGPRFIGNTAVISMTSEGPRTCAHKLDQAP